ncbi:non-reducing end alpha-L-arabinofuranosidase family hydrolase [Streptomyces violaceusniger]|uniref:non-reducing end alpha-L-arabinofuranosidase family hydrolase n=1 Tax=Streptomyces violaceusniger TaxID=68280 RepID=UPI00382C5D76
MVFLLGLAMSLFALPLGPAAAQDASAPAAERATAQLPGSFQWSSSGQLIAPKPDASHPVVSVKDPTVIQAGANTLDYWVICDDAKCYLFSSDDNGHLFRSETTVGEFPGGFRNTQLVLEDSKFALFEGDAVYRVQGTDTYLLMMEAIGSDGRRYYRSFTAQGLTGQWQPLAATESNPFARSNNVSFPAGAWTRDISHGELIRTGNDQTMTINPCRLQFLYQGMNPSAGGDYSQLPWRLGLLTQTNATC